MKTGKVFAYSFVPGLVLGSLLTVLALTVLMHLLFSHIDPHNSNSWAVAISSVTALAVAVATSLLAYVTWRYEKLTRELVRIQGDYISQARAKYREDAVQELNGILTNAAIALRSACLVFPITDDVFPDPTIIKGGPEMGELSQDLSRIHPSLPQTLVADCTDAAAAFVLAQEAQYALYESLRYASGHFVRDLEHPEKAWTWDDCRDSYSRLITNHKIWDGDWDDLRSGKYVLEASSIYEKLTRKVIRYMTDDFTITEPRDS